MEIDYHIELGLLQRNYDGERICGDVFISEKLKDEKRMVSVLADGMGHGVKANILATLTSTMGFNFTKDKKPFERIADIILNTLPTASDRLETYSTFTIVEIQVGGTTKILEYGNPQTMIFRGAEILDPEWKDVVAYSSKVRSNELKICEFEHQKNDRIICFSDGVMQSGLGKDGFVMGWGRENVLNFAQTLIKNEPETSGHILAKKIVTRAIANDDNIPKDDISCVVHYFRNPRKTLLFTGPPYNPSNDGKIAEEVKKFNGRKIICGATTTEILARELQLKIEDDYTNVMPGFPPTSKLDGFDLVTEGVITLSAVAEILNNYYEDYKYGKNPADKIVKMLLDSDDIEIIVGTGINKAHLDPTLPQEIEVRRTVVRRIISLLEDRFLKDVQVNYV